jgi:DNA recombination protein RmuC
METALLVATGLLVGLGIAAFGFFILRARPVVPDPEVAAAATAADQRMVELGTFVKTMGDVIASRQTELARHVNERLDAVSHRLGESMQTTTKHTVENLAKLNERLAVIDNAQKNITDLASQVTSLQNVLSNKQTRGAFGQGQMEMIIKDGLPPTAYEFQHTLKNGKRPDCVVFLPDQRPLVIDAKFPLEAVTALRDAKTDDERKSASARIRQDVMKHVADISERYLIVGETQDLALMFVPSESVYAELHEGFADIVQKAHRHQVMLVSPTLLMLAIQLIQQIQKDARMREAADQIRDEVGLMMNDIRLLSDRVRKFKQHLGNTNDDLENILTSTGRIEKRGDRIRQVEFEEDEALPPVHAAPVFKLQAGE